MFWKEAGVGEGVTLTSIGVIICDLVSVVTQRPLVTLKNVRLFRSPLTISTEERFSDIKRKVT